MARPKTIVIPGLQKRLTETLGAMQQGTGKTRKEIAADLGIGATAITALLTGQSKRPSRQTLKLLEMVYGVREEWLLTGKGEKFTEATQTIESKNGITVYTDEFNELFCATVAGWAHLLTHYAKYRMGRRDVKGIGYEVAENAMEIPEPPYEFRSLPLNYFPGTPPEDLLFRLSAEERTIVMVVRNEFQEKALAPGLPPVRLYLVKQFLTVDWQPILMNMVNPYALELEQNQLSQMVKGLYVRS